MIKNKYNTWIYRSLEVGLAVNADSGIDVTVIDSESGEDYRLSFNRRMESVDEITNRIGEEIYSWISLMIDQIEDEEFDY